MNRQTNNRDPVGRLPSAGVLGAKRTAADLGPETQKSESPEIMTRVGEKTNARAGSGDPAYKSGAIPPVGRVPTPGVPFPEAPPRRLRRLHRVWPDRDGNISYLFTICVEGRGRVLDNELTFERFVAFLLDSPARYHWFGRRFVIMPDHIHLIAHQGREAIRLGQWIKALKAVVGGLNRRDRPDAGSGDPAYNAERQSAVGRVPTPGSPEFTRIERAWRWQEGFHDHKFRTPESESRKWEYVCLNPVRAGLVKRPEEWPFGGEIFHDEAGGPRLFRGTPPLLETGILIQEEGKKPGGSTRPTI